MRISVNNVAVAIMLISLGLAPLPGSALASTESATVDDGQVVISGTVPDNATQARILGKLRTVYGEHKVINRLRIGGVVAPAHWGSYVESMIGSNLEHLSAGSITVQGNSVAVSGNVSNEAERQQLLSSLATAFDSHYAISQNLTVRPPPPKPEPVHRQSALDKTLANRTIEFKVGSDLLTSRGRHILDEMASTIHKLDDPFILIIGNTDNTGSANKNLILSLKRARAVKRYLESRAIPAANLSVSGQGADNPVASNDTPKGRARNRRIDFKVLKK